MTIILAEQILLDKFKKEPFHNLYVLYGKNPQTLAYGGTCSDKTLSYLEALQSAGIDAYLHSARINGMEIHRLIRLEIDGQRYFADVGNGWPSIHVFPTNSEVSYGCYGMRYRTTIADGILRVYHMKNGTEKLQMDLDIAVKSEANIRHSITNRFNENIIYPFANSLRFSMVVNEQFLFIRGTQLEIYGTDYYKEIYGIDDDNLSEIVTDYFGYDMSVFQRYR